MRLLLKSEEDGQEELQNPPSGCFHWTEQILLSGKRKEFPRLVQAYAIQHSSHPVICAYFLNWNIIHTP